MVYGYQSTWCSSGFMESNPGPQEKPCADQGRQEPTRMPIGPNPGLPEMPCPKQEEQEPASLPSVKTGSSISRLETPELNPDPQRLIKLLRMDGNPPTH
ncbi:hypothetical protein DSO57_1031131 [Entomophthora muscae]|uniref:Uncharacterized protein n=1 Tax=Entomophthora muscae TaxID=34485 RepID=A0ACC2SDN4_9FUNG|nr:hypothetical protein DSO57_1031131 [Entomophthora muscae]